MKYFALAILTFIFFPVFSSGWIQMADYGGVARHRSTGLSIENKAYMGLGHYNGLKFYKNELSLGTYLVRCIHDKSTYSSTIVFQ